MRSVRSLLLLPALVALAGFSRAPGAAEALPAGVFCNNNGGGTFYCETLAGGGSGYTYDWRYTETAIYPYNPPRRQITSDPWVTDSCTVGRRVTVTLTVTDSQGATRREPAA